MWIQSREELTIRGLEGGGGNERAGRMLRKEVRSLGSSKVARASAPEGGPREPAGHGPF